MQIEDVRVLLRMPKAGYPAGCNFAAVAVVFNMIGGVPVCFYDASPKALTNGDRGQQRNRSPSQATRLRATVSDLVAVAASVAATPDRTGAATSEICGRTMAHFLTEKPTRAGA